MIYLYTMPGLAFNSPQISNCLTKGYLQKKKIKVKHIDLSIDFLENCLNLSYIKNNLLENYIKLNAYDKKIIDKIENSINFMKAKNISSEEIIKANEIFGKALNIFASLYNLEWHRNGINFNCKVNDIDELLGLAFDKDNSMFDFTFSRELKKKSEDIICLSIKYPYQIPFALRFSKMLKDNNRCLKIILNGDYITHIIDNCSELVNKCDYIDGIVFYGYQKTLLELIKYFKNGGSANIANTLIRNNNNKIIHNSIKKIKFDDIDDYVPSFEDLNLNKYLSNIKLIPLILNYGCYHSKCSFCSRYHYYGGYCKLNIQNICKLIKREYDKNNIEAIYFVDECVPTEILLEISKYLIENKIKIKWMVETRIEKDLLDNNAVRLMYDSGCREISFGIESYNKRVLKDMNKNIDLSIAKKIIKNFYLSGISVSATFMINYPTEFIFNIIKTLNFINRFKYLDSFGLTTFKYMRNSILVNKSNIDVSTDLNLIYILNNNNYKIVNYLLKIFYNRKKIKRFINIRNKILYRTEYLYLNREKFSLNFKDNKRSVDVI